MKSKWFHKYVRKIGIFGVEVEFHPPTDTALTKPEPENASAYTGENKPQPPVLMASTRPVQKQQKPVVLDGFIATQPISQRPAVRLKVSAEQALALIRQIPHSTCQRAVPNNWKLAPSGQATPESVDWLYCWAKTGMNSQRAADFAQRVFDTIFDMSFTDYDAQVDHDEARRNRYSS